jgi:hypothetical protein
MKDKKQRPPKKPEAQEGGKFHYNPGNMSGKKIDTPKEDDEPKERSER